ncbi:MULTISPECIES: CYTH domain-containing protein [Rhodomicrobium]|uniref:CYTH domain-containing protein n=1 Tax=Rhodomicrobium TaxID=1068 RepID=UPI000B4A6CEC|nr:MULTISPECIES: CYTH domain-containing protein [Rhodomicrobium]
MGVEIERKFLVATSDWMDAAVSSRELRQAYMAVTPAASIRIRIEGESAAWLTIKSAAAGIERAEFEYAIPVSDAAQLLTLRTGGVVQKRRHIVPAGGDICWEIDVFGGRLEGLVIAEIELETREQTIPHPNWLGEEITGDARFSNANLAMNGLPEGFLR